MKKLIYCAAALATAIFAGSCQQELLDTPAGENTVTYTVEVPEVATKAIADGKNVDRLFYEVYVTNAENVTNLDGSTLLYKKDIAMVQSNEATSRANVTLNLVQNQYYTVLFWAQCGEANEGLYDVTDLKAVTYRNGVTVKANHEDYAAFYAVDCISDNTPRNKKVYLKRPFAQLNIGTLNTVDYSEDPYTVTMKKSKVTVKQVPTVFNVATSAVDGLTDLTFTWEELELINDEQLVVNDKNYDYIAMNYMFAGENRTAKVEYELEAVMTTQGNVEVSADLAKSVVNVPLKENYRTNIVGNLLTSSTEYEVIVDADWAGADLAPDPLYLAAANGGNVTLNANVTLDQPLDIKADMALNLNGKTITGTLNVAAGANVTVENGAIVNTDKTVSGITSNGILTLNNVEIESARHALRIESGSAVINGGTYKVNPISNSTLYALNVGDGANSIANVTIKGGKFIGPKGTMADSGGAVTVKVGSTVKIEGGDFSGGKTKTLSAGGTITITGGSYDQDPTAYVAEGYKAVEKDAVFHVVDANTTVVANAEELATAISTGQDIKLASNIETSEQITITGAQTRSVIASVTIDGNGKTLTYTGSGATARAIDVPATANGINVTVKNLTIDCTSSYCQRGINYNTNGKLVLDNVTVQGQNVTYAINLPGSSDNANVEIKNSSLTGNIALNVWGENAMITATDSHFTSVDNAIHENYSAIVLNNDGSTIADGAVINIIGGTITALDENGEPSNAIRNSTNTGIINVSETTIVIGKQTEPVAVVTYGGNEFYSCETLQRAINKAAESNAESVRLIKDITVEEGVIIEEGQTVVLDLNGKTLTASEKCLDGYAITNKGKLTIKNNGEINGVVYAEGATAETIIDGGTYNALENAKFVLLNSQGASLTINAATINGGSSYPIYSYDANSKLVINDATVNATFGCINAYGTGGEVVINGGTFKMTGVQGKTSHIAYFSNVDAVINGGTFEKVGDINMSGTGGGGICAIYGAALTINNGTFAGDYADVYNWSGTNKNGRDVIIAIKGGTYKFKPNEDFLAKDYKAVKTSDVFKVIPSDVTLCNSAIKDKEAKRYEGEVFESGYMENALWFNNYLFEGEAAIQVADKTYNAIIIENCAGNFRNHVLDIQNDNSSVVVMQNLDFTLEEGCKLIKSENTYYQVFMANITINGEKQTQESIAKYLENVSWYEVVEEI